MYEAGKKENSLTVVEISNPVVDGRDLVYRYKLLEGTVPKSGGATSLFIDWIGPGRRCRRRIPRCRRRRPRGRSALNRPRLPIGTVELIERYTMTELSRQGRVVATALLLAAAWAPMSNAELTRSR